MTRQVGLGIALAVVVLLALRVYSRPDAPAVVRAEGLPPVGSAEARGRLVYERYGCRLCHGEEGKDGIANPNALGTGKVPSVVIEYAAEGYTAAELRRLVSNGTSRIERDDPEGPPPPYRMPGWGDRMSDQEIADLAQYLLSLDPKTVEPGMGLFQ